MVITLLPVEKILLTRKIICNDQTCISNPVETIYYFRKKLHLRCLAEISMHLSINVNFRYFEIRRLSSCLGDKLISWYLFAKCACLYFDSISSPDPSGIIWDSLAHSNRPCQVHSRIDQPRGGHIGLKVAKHNNLGEVLKNILRNLQ